MQSPDYPRVVFPDGFDERAAFEVPLKGWLSARIEAEDGARYAVSFFDPVRLQQELEDDTKRGQPYFAEPGLIVLPEVTVEAIEGAVQSLWQRGFFARLRAEHNEVMEAALVTFDPDLLPDVNPGSSQQNQSHNGQSERTLNLTSQ